MKWKLAIIVCCYVIGAGFLTAWHFEVEKRIINPPNGRLGLDQIMWMMTTGYVFLSIGSTTLVHLLVDKIPLFVRRRESADRK